MQLGLVRAPLTPEEKLRGRQANLCLYCGGTGHFLRTCPVRPSKSYSQVVMNYQVSVFFTDLCYPLCLPTANEKGNPPASHI